MSYHRIISGEAGAWATPLRAGLSLLEPLYRLGVAWRNRRYDRRGGIRAAVPVISVGNLTAGGTGKTPFVLDLVSRLERLGRTPVIVARGYRAVADEPNDEQRLVQWRCPSVVCLAEPDRVLGAELARTEYGADVVVLDDGFQHRRLARDLDIVLIDATCPFGFGHLLPRGLLREPCANLRRADMVVISRCDQASPAETEQLATRLQALAPDALHLRCRHKVVGVETLAGEELHGGIEGKRVVLFAGLGNPRAFATTVETLGAQIVGRHWWPDHHEYRRRDLAYLAAPGRFPEHDLMLTTEKDAVKLVQFAAAVPENLGVVRVAIDFIDGGGTILTGAVEQTLRAVDR